MSAKVIHFPSGTLLNADDDNPDQIDRVGGIMLSFAAEVIAEQVPMHMIARAMSKITVGRRDE